jgi:hypothetical protein
MVLGILLLLLMPFLYRSHPPKDGVSGLTKPDGLIGHAHRDIFTLRSLGIANSSSIDILSGSTPGLSYAQAPKPSSATTSSQVSVAVEFSSSKSDTADVEVAAAPSSEVDNLKLNQQPELKLGHGKATAHLIKKASNNPRQL